MSRTTFAVIERTALGEAASFDREEFLKQLRLALASVPWRRTIALFDLPDWMPHPGYFKARSATAYLYNETMKAVAARRATGSGQRDILGLLAFGARSGNRPGDDRFRADRQPLFLPDRRP